MEHDADDAAWRTLAAAHHRRGALAEALEAYEQALIRAPEDVALLSAVGDLALQMQAFAVAETLFRRALELDSTAGGAGDGLARALRGQHRYADAIAVLQPMLGADPLNAHLWNTLGTVLNQQGDSAKALIFFDEAVRLDPRLAVALYNRSGVQADLGDLAVALSDCEAAVALSDVPADTTMMRFARSTMLLSLGDLGQGWDAYEARLEPGFPGRVEYAVDVPLWTPDAPLPGKSLLVMAEQGLGDELMFASMIGDVVAALGPRGRLTLAVDPRLVALFQRSFETVEVVAHTTVAIGSRRRRSAPQATALGGFDLWAPLGSLTRRFRRAISAFPQTSGVLSVDPVAIERSHSLLRAAPPGAKIGVTWRSAVLIGERRRLYAPLSAWRPVLQTPGATFVNLQYGSCENELAEVSEAFGVDIWRTPGLDLREDLDGLAAFCSVLDLVVGCENATTQLAAACGVRTWIVCARSWRQLGTEAYPWRPSVQTIAVPGFDAWPSALAAVADQLQAEMVGEAQRSLVLRPDDRSDL